MFKSKTFVRAALAIFVGLCTLASIRFYTVKIADTSRWTKDLEVMDPSRSSELLFQRATDFRQIRAEMTPDGTPVLRVMSCDTLDAPGRGLKNEERSVLTFLCTSKNGENLRNQISAWNESFFRLAVRDDRIDAMHPDDKGNCARTPPPDQAIYYSSCPTSDWRLESSDGARPWRSASASASLDPVTLSAFSQLGVRSAFHDWTAAVLNGSAKLHYRFSTVLSVDKRDVHIQLAALPISIRVDGIEIMFTPGKRRIQNVGGLRVEAVTAVEGQEPPAWSECPPPPRMMCIVLSNVSRPRAQPVPVDIEANAAASEPSCRENRGDKNSFCPGGTIMVSCPSRPGRNECKPRWLTHTSPEPRGDEEFEVTDRYGTPLLEGEHISRDALQAGLGPLIGLGSEDTGSLIANLSSGDRTKKYKLKLTIDYGIQLSAEAILRNKMAIKEQKPPCEDCKQRGVIIVLDAGDDRHAGEILALATWPVIDSGFNSWDLKASLADRATANNPVRRYAWQDLDRSSTPGSIFKAVTSMAAIDEISRHNETLRSLVFGERLTDAQQALSIRSVIDKATCYKHATGGELLVIEHQHSLVARCIRSYHGEELSEIHEKKIYDSCGQQDGIVDLCGALAVSSNTWFGGMENLMDGNRLATQSYADLALTRSADRLFPWITHYRTARIGPNGIRDDNLIADASRFPNRGRPSTLRIQPIEFEAERATTPDGRRDEQVSAGFGQNVKAAPVVLAAIYATLGAGRAVRPHIDLTPAEITPDCSHPQTSAAPQQSPPGPGADLIAPLKCLDILENIDTPDTRSALEAFRRGLHAVVLRGTAASAHWASQLLRLPDNTARLFAKTGTATPDDRSKRNVAGLAGWIEGNTASSLKRRVAFLCVIAWTSQSGANACSKPIHDLLQTMRYPRQ